MQWNADNRLTYVKNRGELAIITFTYDTSGVLLAQGTVTDTTAYVGGIYEKELRSGDERLYFFGGQRIAMEEEGTLHYLLGDHLGTTSVVIKSNGTLGAESRHYPYGEERWSSGTVPTDYRFTGQLQESDLSIYIMGARWYDPYISWFLSPDSIIPQPANPQSMNRFSYAYGNPLKFIDPSRHDPLDAEWLAEFHSVHGRDPTWEDILIRLFSIAFPEEWSRDSWNSLYSPDGELRPGAVRDLFRVVGDGTWAGMPEALEHMAGWYQADETEEFVRDIGSLFGGLATRLEESSGLQAVRSGGTHLSVWVGRSGLPDEYLGNDLTGNVHHWAWALNLGCDTGPPMGQAVNTARELNGVGWNWYALVSNRNAFSDVGLGNVAVAMGAYVRRWPWHPRAPQELKNVWAYLPLAVSAE